MVLLAIGGSGGTLIFFLLGKRVMEWFRLRYVRRSPSALRAACLHVPYSRERTGGSFA
ncbi:MAG: hypothetical protein IPP83_15860 [Flavobacteriales bacterium]|nr:hypothetical protein [Flavobacteriales bacterium]